MTTINKNPLEGYGSQFFADQHVYSNDLNAIEYSKTKVIRDYLKEITKTPGVIATDFTTDDSLKVTSSSDGTTFTVSPGTAIDAYGRIIHVPTTPTAVSGSLSADPLYYPARPPRSALSTGIGTDGTYYVNLRYALLHGSPQYNDAGEQFYTRAYDSYSISVGSSPAADGVTLARVVLDIYGNIAADTSSSGQNGRAVYDTRVLYVQHQGGIAELTSLVNSHSNQLNETIDRSIGFQYPVEGDLYTTTLARNATIERLKMYITTNEGVVDTATCIFSAGTTSSSLITIATLSATSPDVIVSQSILAPDNEYTAGNLIRFYLSYVGVAVKECTIILEYKRR